MAEDTVGASFGRVMAALRFAAAGDLLAASDEVAALAELEGARGLFQAICVWLAAARQVDADLSGDDWVCEFESDGEVIDPRQLPAEAQGPVLAAQLISTYLNGDTEATAALFRSADHLTVVTAAMVVLRLAGETIAMNGGLDA